MRYTEGFLETVFGGVERQFNAIGRVTVDVNYEAVPDDSDASRLPGELRSCLQQELTKSINLSSPQGHDITPSDNYPLLKKYLKAITLHRDILTTGSWIQVLPFGSVGTPAKSLTTF